eukprot:gene4973-5095_t
MPQGPGGEGHGGLSEGAATTLRRASKLLRAMTTGGGDIAPRIVHKPPPGPATICGSQTGAEGGQIAFSFPDGTCAHLDYAQGSQGGPVDMYHTFTPPDKRGGGHAK